MSEDAGKLYIGGLAHYYHVALREIPLIKALVGRAMFVYVVTVVSYVANIS